MSKFNNDVKLLVEYVGGKENVVSLTHCATRMRFVLADEDKADLEKIEALESVKGSFTQGGQFQIIIGNAVSDFYKEFTELTQLEGDSKEELKSKAKNNMNWLQRMVTNLAEIFAPIIPAIIAGGLILGFRNVIGDIKMFEDGTKTLVEVSVFWNGIFNFLWLIGEAVFHFLPVGIVWSICKKMKGTEILGIVTGITLVSPQLLNAYAVSVADEIPFWDFGAFQINMTGYQGQVIPAILVGLALVYTERLFKKITPDVIKMIVVPFFSLTITVILAHTVLGPIGWTVGNAISTVVQAGFNSGFSWLFGGIYGFLYCILVITGLHHTILAIDLQLIGDIGGTYIWPIHALCGMAQSVAVIAYLVVKRKEKEELQIGVPAAISASLGVAEPAIFGINLKYFYPFLAALIGSGVGGLISSAYNCMANSIGISGIPAFLSMKPQSMPGYIIAAAATMITTFVLTLVFSKTKLAKKK